MNKGKKFISRGEYDVTEKGLKSASLKILPAGSVLFSSRAPIGYLAVARNPVTTNQGFKSFVPKDFYTTEFIYYTLDHLEKVIEHNASGSTFKEVSGSVLKSVQTYLPKKDVINKFNNLLDPIFQKQNLVELENSGLENLRNWLLPMLMNGQVSVGEAEEELRMVAEKAENYGL